MLDFDTIRAQYPPHLQGFARALLREYLQYKILQGLFEQSQAHCLSFLGDTALRLVHGNQRFSEDIDLDIFGLTWEAFASLVQGAGQFLERDGFEVTLTMVARGAFHCSLRFPQLLYQQGLSPLQQERILIQVDSMAQGYAYQPTPLLINRFDVFTQILVTPLPVLLSQKLYTAVNRPRPKGRDFYDITFLLGRTSPDYGFLAAKMGVETPRDLQAAIAAQIQSLDFAALAQDVAPFVIDQDHLRRVRQFRQFWAQVDLG